MATFEEQLTDSLSHAYDIERELGGGGMSRVFVATDKSLGRKVVIKLLSPELTAEVNRGRFRREIQVAAQLQHPHIVTLLSAGEHDDLVYYTMPFIEGESLKSALEKEGPLAVADVVRVLYDVVDALAYAHRHGVVHRDIKPANILRSGSHALVTDFGVAKALNAAMPSSAMTSTGMAIGTPAYMAPEQLAGDPTADHRIDLYAIGLLSYELLSGTSPFAASTAQGVLAAVLTREPKPLHEVRKDVPRKLSAILMQCLSKVPGGRPPNAESLLEALDMIATASGEIRTREHRVPSKARTPSLALPAILAATPALAPTTAVESPPQQKSSRSMLGVGIAGVLFAAAAAGFLIWQNAGKASKADAQTSPTQSVSVPGSPAGGGATSVAATTVAPPVPLVVDSVAIANAVTKRLEQAQAAALALAEKTGKAGKPSINADSVRRVVKRELADSIARVNAQRSAAAAAAAAAAQPPGPAPTVVAVAPPVAGPVDPPASGKRRLAITSPRESSQPALNSFTRSFIDALRISLDQSDAFDPIDQDSVREVQARTGSRDEAAKVLKPDIMVWPGYVGTGDTVNVIVTVWDMRSNSSYGIRVTSTKLAPADPEHYLGPLVQSVMKQLNDLAKMPTIYRRQ